MDTAIDRELANAKRRFFLPWLGTVLCVLALAGIGYALAGGAEAHGERLPTLPKWMTVAGFSWCGLLLFVRLQIMDPLGIAARIPAADPAAVVRHLFAGYLVLWSAALGPPIIGIAQILAGGDARMHLLLCAAALLVLVYLMPVQSKLAAQAGVALAILEKALGTREGPG